MIWWGGGKRERKKSKDASEKGITTNKSLWVAKEIIQDTGEKGQEERTSEQRIDTDTLAEVLGSWGYFLQRPLIAKKK